MASQQIAVQDLDFKQLSEVKKQLDDVRPLSLSPPLSPTLRSFVRADLRFDGFQQELEHLTNSFGQLKQAQAKFKACVNDVSEIDPKNTST